MIAGAVLLALLTLAFVGAFIQYLKGDEPSFVGRIRNLF